MKSWNKHDKVYIVPSLRGVALLFVLLVLLIIGLTYSNNIIMGMTFFLTSLFISAMFEAHFYLRDLKLTEVIIRDQYAGDAHSIILKFTHPTPARHFHGRLSFGQDQQTLFKLIQDFSLPLTESSFELAQKGKHKIEWISVRNYSPNFLFRTWKYFKVDCEFYTYPARFKHMVPMKLLGDQKRHHEGEEELSIEKYHDFSFGSLHWKKTLQMGEPYMKGRELYHSDLVEVNLDEISPEEASHRLYYANLHRLPFDFSLDHKNIKLSIEEALRRISIL